MTGMLRRLALLATLMAPAGCAGGQSAAGAPAPASFQRADTASLHRTLDSLADAHHGIAGYTIYNLDTGERLEKRGDETFP